MSLTKCSRCHRESGINPPGITCGKRDAFDAHPCMGTMRRVDVPTALRIWHLVNHMKMWELHLLKLESIYTRDQNYPCLQEVKADRQKLIQWRERLDSIDPRRNRKDGVSILQGDEGSQVQESKRSSINDTPVH